jgi:hypothetical protein
MEGSILPDLPVGAWLFIQISMSPDYLPVTYLVDRSAFEDEGVGSPPTLLHTFLMFYYFLSVGYLSVRNMVPTLTSR